MTDDELSIGKRQRPCPHHEDWVVVEAGVRRCLWGRGGCGSTLETPAAPAPDADEEPIVAMCDTKMGEFHADWLLCKRCGIRVSAAKQTLLMIAELGAEPRCIRCVLETVKPGDVEKAMGADPTGALVPLVQAVKAWRKVKKKR